jgi:hypothetical protein
MESIEKAPGFEIPKSTVSDIKKNKEKIQNFVSRTFHGIGKN